jgi:hypothetical protein
METDFKKPPFYRSLMVAVFVGILTTLLTMFYDLLFVDVFKFPLSAIINVASLIFAVNLIFLVIGPVYYAFITLFRKGDILFIAVFILLTAFLVWKAEGTHRTDDPVVNMQFRNLLAGIIILIGLSALCIPFLFHSKKFEKHVV